MFIYHQHMFLLFKWSQTSHVTLIDLVCWAGTCGTSAVPILENTSASSYEKHDQHFCMNSTYALSLQYCSRVGRVRNVQPWFNSEGSWQIPKTHGWRPDNCQVLLCWVRPAQLQHMVEPSEPSVPEFFFSASKSKKYIYIQKSHLRTRKPHDGLQPADKWPLMQVKSAAKSLAEATFYHIYIYIHTHM